MSVLCGVASVASAQTTVLWPPSGEVDTFEYADNAALDVVYSAVTLQAGYGVSTEQNHSATGTKSVKMGDGDNIRGEFAAIIDNANTTATASYYMYETDASATGPNRMALTFASYENGAYAAGALGNYLILGTYTTAPGNNTQYWTRAVYGATGADTGWKTTGVTRTNGWHKMEISVQDGVSNFRVDDTVLVNTYTKPSYGFNCFKLGAIAGTDNLDTYYDDFVIASKDVSAVGNWYLY